MVGDRPTTDGALADPLGWPFALVLSGVAGYEPGPARNRCPIRRHRSSPTTCSRSYRASSPPWSPRNLRERATSERPMRKECGLWQW